jgi:hypothetical protein
VATLAMLKGAEMRSLLVWVVVMATVGSTSCLAQLAGLGFGEFGV